MKRKSPSLYLGLIVACICLFGMKAIAHGTARFRASTDGLLTCAADCEATGDAGPPPPGAAPPLSPQALHRRPAHSTITAISRVRTTTRRLVDCRCLRRAARRRQPWSAWISPGHGKQPGMQARCHPHGSGMDKGRELVG